MHTFDWRAFEISVMSKLYVLGRKKQLKSGMLIAGCKEFSGT
jgi:hypothetical protein